MSVANSKRYDCDSSCECGRYGDDKMRECDVGEYVKFEILQQLKAEILPLLTDALEEFADRKFDRGEYYLKQAMVKISAV